MPYNGDLMGYDDWDNVGIALGYKWVYPLVIKHGWLVNPCKFKFS